MKQITDINNKIENSEQISYTEIYQFQEDLGKEIGKTSTQVETNSDNEEVIANETDNIIDNMGRLLELQSETGSVLLSSKEEINKTHSKLKTNTTTLNKELSEVDMKIRNSKSEEEKTALKIELRKLEAIKTASLFKELGVTMTSQIDMLLNRDNISETDLMKAENKLKESVKLQFDTLKTATSRDKLFFNNMAIKPNVNKMLEGDLASINSQLLSEKNMTALSKNIYQYKNEDSINIDKHEKILMSTEIGLEEYHNIINKNDKIKEIIKSKGIDLSSPFNEEMMYNIYFNTDVLDTEVKQNKFTETSQEYTKYLERDLKNDTMVIINKDENMDPDFLKVLDEAVYTGEVIFDSETKSYSFKATPDKDKPETMDIPLNVSKALKLDKEPSTVSFDKDKIIINDKNIGNGIRNAKLGIPKSNPKVISETTKQNLSQFSNVKKAMAENTKNAIFKENIQKNKINVNLSLLESFKRNFNEEEVKSGNALKTYLEVQDRLEQDPAAPVTKEETKLIDDYHTSYFQEAEIVKDLEHYINKLSELNIDKSNEAINTSIIEAQAQIDLFKSRKPFSEAVQFQATENVVTADISEALEVEMIEAPERAIAIEAPKKPEPIAIAAPNVPLQIEYKKRVELKKDMLQIGTTTMKQIEYKPRKVEYTWKEENLEVAKQLMENFSLKGKDFEKHSSNANTNHNNNGSIKTMNGGLNFNKLADKKASYTQSNFSNSDFKKLTEQSTSLKITKEEIADLTLTETGELNIENLSETAQKKFGYLKPTEKKAFVNLVKKFTEENKIREITTYSNFVEEYGNASEEQMTETQEFVDNMEVMANFGNKNDKQEVNKSKSKISDFLDTINKKYEEKKSSQSQKASNPM
jgi:hypothetical protein